MRTRGRKPINGVNMINIREMHPFLVDIKGCMKELHTAVQMYEIELRDQGYTFEDAARKAAADAFQIKQEIC
jgi:hypothetical protein